MTSPHIVADSDIEAYIGSLLEQTAFQILSVDGKQWINPFTLEYLAVGVNEEVRHVSAKWLKIHKPWEHNASHRYDTVSMARWFLHLREYMADDTRFQFFLSPHWWLNPYNGTWVEHIPFEQFQVNVESIRAIAIYLSHNDPGPPYELLSISELESCYQRMRHRGHRSPSVLEQQHNVTEAVSNKPIADSKPHQHTQVVRPAGAKALDVCLENGIQVAASYPLNSVQINGFCEVMPLGPNGMLFFLGEILGDEGGQLAQHLVEEMRAASGAESSWEHWLAHSNSLVATGLGRHQTAMCSALIYYFDDHSCWAFNLGAGPLTVIQPHGPTVVGQCGGQGIPFGRLTGDALVQRSNPQPFSLNAGASIVLCQRSLWQENNPCQWMGAALAAAQSHAEDIIDAVVPPSPNAPLAMAIRRVEEAS